jgi:hypothetical protein
MGINGGAGRSGHQFVWTDPLVCHRSGSLPDVCPGAWQEGSCVNLWSVLRAVVCVFWLILRAWKSLCLRDWCRHRR